MDDEETVRSATEGTRRTVRRLAWALLTAMAGLPVVVVVAGSLLGEDPSGDPGRLTETLHTWTAADGPVPQLTDVTDTWGLGTWRHTHAAGQRWGGHRRPGR